jgi:hypothetical protein
MERTRRMATDVNKPLSRLVCRFLSRDDDAIGCFVDGNHRLIPENTGGIRVGTMRESYREISLA